MAGPRSGVGVSVEAALNLCREELRAVVDVRLAVLNDEALKKADPGHRDDLLKQSRREIQQLSRAIGILDRIQTGELIEADMVAPLPPLRVRAEAPARLSVLRRASPPEPWPERRCDHASGALGA